MPTIPLERKFCPTRDDFARDHLTGIGKPVIVTGAIEQWPASKKWSFEYFKSAYGSDFVVAPLDLMSDIGKVTTLAAYLDYLDNPEMELPGFWIDLLTDLPLSDPPSTIEVPHYLTGWNAFAKHPKLYRDIEPAPAFIDDYLLGLDSTLRDVLEVACSKEYWSLYVGPKGTLSSLHQDFWRTHSILAQIAGRKHVKAISPEDGEFLYGGAVDLSAPDLERFPLFAKATVYEGIIGPGEILFTPPDWWHWVMATENSITVSHNFFNQVNFSEHMKGILGGLPSLARQFDQRKAWREKLAVNWTTADFAVPVTRAVEGT